jgi:hypothetical protein
MVDAAGAPQGDTISLEGDSVAPIANGICVFPNLRIPSVLVRHRIVIRFSLCRHIQGWLYVVDGSQIFSAPSVVGSDPVQAESVALPKSESAGPVYAMLPPGMEGYTAVNVGGQSYLVPRSSMPAMPPYMMQMSAPPPPQAARASQGLVVARAPAAAPPDLPSYARRRKKATERKCEV